MERSKHIIIFLSVFLVAQLKAQINSDIYRAYISNNMDNWKIAMDKLDPQPNKSNETMLQLVNYQYGYIAWCIGHDRDDVAEEYLEKAEQYLDILMKTESNLSLVNSYRSAFYGFRIGISPYKAPFYGSKSIDCAKLAMVQDKENPYGYLQYGNAQYYMPAIFGGSKTVALDYFRTAQKLMEANESMLIENWNYLSLLALIGNAYSELENFTEAKFYYDKALSVEPNFLWVKNSLYPNLLKKIKQ